MSFQPGPYPFFANASRVRTTVDGVARLVTDAQRWFATHGRSDFMWFLGPSSTPGNLREVLIGYGAVLESEDTALVLTEEPPPAVEVCRVNTRQEFTAFRELMLLESADQVSPDVQAVVAAGHEQAWADLQAYQGRRMNFLAYLDGVAQSAASLLIGDDHLGILAGGTTRSTARGQGCYRALVSAHWQAARQAGCTALAVQASTMSAPILSNLGFRQVAALTVLR